MITNAVGGFLLNAVQGLLSFLPDADDLMLDGFGQAVSVLRGFNSALPVAETIAMATMCLALIGGIFVTRLFITLYKLIPGKFT